MAKNRYTGPYVSRGGEKLRGALRDFSIDPAGMRALDVGASTGGFTDCLLQAGASSVVALDVAYGQFAWKLRQDPRVHVLERTNFRDADLSELPEPFQSPYDLVVADLSFISLAKLSEQFKAVLRQCFEDGVSVRAPLVSTQSDDVSGCHPDRSGGILGVVAEPDVRSFVQGDLVLLVKPQFEALRDEVPKGGVITDLETHVLTLGRLARAFLTAGIESLEWTYSPIKGPKGNIEFWLHARAIDNNLSVEPDSKVSANSPNCATIDATMKTAILPRIEEVVAAAHSNLNTL